MKVKHFNYLGIFWLKFAKYSAVYINLINTIQGTLLYAKQLSKYKLAGFQTF